MKKSIFSKLFLTLSLIALPVLVFANGFQINEQGAKALGMGGAFVAQADDPSAVYFNPAGITQLEGVQISLGVSPITPSATFKSDQTGKSTDAKKNTFYIPNFYATLKATDKISVGFGAFSNFGLSTEWPKDWEGRYITGGTKAEVVTLTLNPNVAFKFTDKLSLAFGVDIQKMEIELENKIHPAQVNYLTSGMSTEEGNSKLKADDWSYGWNIALHSKITENWKLGVSYRSKVKHKFEDGTAILNLNIVEKQLTGSSNVDLPDILYLGTSYKLNKFTFEFDAQRTGWSSYDKLAVDFEDPTAQDISKPKDWKDVWAYRFGVQYKVNDMLDLRAGLIRDFSPIPDKTLDPLVPSGDRWLYAVGFGLNFSKITLDFAYNYLDDENRRFDNEAGKTYLGQILLNEVSGEFKSVDAHIFGINVTYRF